MTTDIEEQLKQLHSSFAIEIIQKSKNANLSNSWLA